MPPALPRVHSIFIAFASCQSFALPNLSIDLSLHIRQLRNTVKMQFKNLALLTAVAGTAVADFAIVTTPIPTNLGDVLTNVCSQVHSPTTLTTQR